MKHDPFQDGRHFSFVCSDKEAFTLVCKEGITLVLMYLSMRLTLNAMKENLTLCTKANTKASVTN